MGPLISGKSSLVKYYNNLARWFPNKKGPNKLTTLSPGDAQFSCHGWDFSSPFGGPGPKKTPMESIPWKVGQKTTKKRSQSRKRFTGMPSVSKKMTIKWPFLVTQPWIFDEFVVATISLKSLPETIKSLPETIKSLPETIKWLEDEIPLGARPVFRSYVSQ